VRVVEAIGAVYTAAERFLATVKRQLDDANRLRAVRAAAAFCAPRQNSALKTIDDFRNNPVYCGDGTRVDLAYAIYALGHNVSDAEIRNALGSRDLSHKGNERRQQEYIERTTRKAALLLEKQCGRGPGR
jgi:hypothetical protein